MDHTDHLRELTGQDLHHHDQLALSGADLVYNLVRLSPAALNPATMQVVVGAFRLNGRAGYEVFSWSE